MIEEAFATEQGEWFSIHGWGENDSRWPAVTCSRDHQSKVDCIALLLKTSGDEAGYFLFILYNKEAHIS